MSLSYVIGAALGPWLIVGAYAAARTEAQRMGCVVVMAFSFVSILFLAAP